MLASPTSHTSTSLRFTRLGLGLGHFSWFKCMEDVVAGPSGMCCSSPSSSSKNSPASGHGSRPASRAFNFKPASRPHSALLHSGGSRPVSGLSFLHIDPELGAHPPGMHISGTGSTSGGSASGKSGQTIYHDAPSRPQSQASQGQTPQIVSPNQDENEQLVDAPAIPELDFADQTIWPVHALDLLAPEMTLLLTVPLPDSDSASDSRNSSMASCSTGLRYPPGLMNP